MDDNDSRERLRGIETWCAGANDVFRQQEGRLAKVEAHLGSLCGRTKRTEELAQETRDMVARLGGKHEALQEGVSEERLAKAKRAGAAGAWGGLVVILVEVGKRLLGEGGG